MKKNSSNLNKKRARPVSPLTITIGKLPHEKYCYISDSISDKAKNTKIKISMIDMKEDNKQVMGLQIIADAEARINSTYYTKVQGAIDESKIGTTVEEDKVLPLIEAVTFSVPAIV